MPRKSMPRNLVRKWRESRNASLQLDAILAAADPDATLADRNSWLIELGFWIRRDGGLGAAGDGQEPGADRSHPEHVRLRYLLQVLERHPDWAGRFALTVRSIVRENDPTGLFCDTGVALHPGFVSEMVSRLQDRFLPPPPNLSDMAGLFALVFVGDEDAEWVGAIDDELLARLARVLQAGSADSESGGGKAHYREALGQTLVTSIAVLVSQVRATGLSQAIRSRLKGRVEDTPFFAWTKQSRPCVRTVCNATTTASASA